MTTPTGGMDPHAEANHTLAAILYQKDQARKDLEEQIKHIAERGDELDEQYNEAEQLGDEGAMERIRAGIEELHKAYVVAHQALYGDGDASPSGQSDDPTTGEGQPGSEAPQTDETTPADAEGDTGGSGATEGSPQAPTDTAAEGEEAPQTEPSPEG